MHYSLFTEDNLEFDDWHDQENENAAFNEPSSDERLTSKLKSRDHYFRKQGFTDFFLFIQHNTNLDVFPSVFNALKQFSMDEEPSLRCDFAESLITITKVMLSKTVAQWSCVKDFTVPCVTTLLHDNNKQVRLACHATIIFLTENNLMNKELFFEEVYPALEELMVSYNPDELRTECFTILVQIFQVLDNCLEDSLLRFCRDFMSTNDNLRKTCASHLLSIINRSSEEHLSEWLEIFYKLSDDNSWYIKKFCIECAVSLSKKVTREERWDKMANIYHNFMTDSKKWVVICAYQNFGAFIATFADPEKARCDISKEGRVVNMAKTSEKDHSKSSNNLDSVSNDCDCNFGSVAFWKQQIDESLLPEISPISLSLKDIDINQIDSSDGNQYSWPPDLSKYKQEIVPLKLLQSYSNIIHEACDTDIIRPCAFSIPAVILTLGASCWPFLKSAYVKLVQFMSWKVRLSLASSLHHVFHIILEDDTAVSDLLWAYKELIKDVDEVKCGLMANISQFYLSVPLCRYRVLFEDFEDLVHLDNVRNWRYRVGCMEQLNIVITQLNLTSEDDRLTFIYMIINRWLKIVFSFCEQDSVWAVRLAAADTLIAILKRLIKTETDQNVDNETDEYDTVIKQIQDRLVQYSESSIWYIRQLFLHCAVKIATTDVVPLLTLDSIIMAKYLYLCCWDGVPNNRMVGGQGLAQICSHGYFMSTSSDMRKMIENVYHQLKGDKDRDVKDSVEKLNPIFVTASP